MNNPSTRAQVITRRTYNRPLNDEGTVFETWAQTVERVVNHQRFLWERAKTHNLIPDVALHNIVRESKDWVALTEKEE